MQGVMAMQVGSFNTTKINNIIIVEKRNKE
jgi:hypothetical protein